MADAAKDKFSSPHSVSRRRFFSRIFLPALGIASTRIFLPALGVASTTLSLREFYKDLLKGLGGVEFVPYIGVDLKVHLVETRLDSRPDGCDSYRTAKFKGFNLAIHYSMLVANIWYHKIGPKHIYDLRITRTLPPVYAGINDFLIREISRTLVEHLDPRNDIFKCLILKEGLKVIVSDPEPTGGKPRPDSFRIGLKNFTKRIPVELQNRTGYVIKD